MENNKAGGSDEEVESRRINHDADSGNDAASTDMLQKEKQIDPGNEHHHSDTTDDKLTGTSVDVKPERDEAGSDRTGSTGHEPGEGETDAPDTSGEDG